MVLANVVIRVRWISSPFRGAWNGSVTGHITGYPLARGTPTYWGYGLIRQGVRQWPYSSRANIYGYSRSTRTDFHYSPNLC